jgi:hypothetical protein
MVVKKMNKEHLQLIKVLQYIYGQKAWGVSLGEGSFLTFEFGNPIPSDKKVHGEFHVWVYFCAWRIQQLDKIIICSEDKRDNIIESIKCLEDLPLINVKLMYSGFDTVFNFDKDIQLYLFSIYSDEYESWMLYTPNEVISIGPANNLLIEPN